MHHSDRQLDATTSIRFHPGEIFLSGIARLAVIPLLGMELWQLLLYEAVLLPVILFHHSNMRLPLWLDHGLLALIVTPAMHRVHHSRWKQETDSNYGSVFPYWDRLLGSFRLRQDARAIQLGLDEFQEPEWHSIKGMLKTPLRGRGSIKGGANG
jgi:sterol desaturase/sphingolipid hydroxylase (fatty acid hydroxylase superfamily)